MKVSDLTDWILSLLLLTIFSVFLLIPGPMTYGLFMRGSGHALAWCLPVSVQKKGKTEMRPTILVKFNDTSGAKGDSARSRLMRTLLGLHGFAAAGCDFIVVKSHSVGGEDWIKSECRRWGVRRLRLVSLGVEDHQNFCQALPEVRDCVPSLDGPFLLDEGLQQINSASLSVFTPRGDGWLACRRLTSRKDMRVLGQRDYRLTPRHELYEDLYTGLTGFRSMGEFERGLSEASSVSSEPVMGLDVIRGLVRLDAEVYVHDIPTLRVGGLYGVRSVKSSRKTRREGLRLTGT